MDNNTADRPGVGATTHWLSMQAQELVENQKVIQVDSQATIHEACDLLIKHNIQSLPLYDSQNRSYIGMFDLHDLATYILMNKRQHIEPPSSPSTSSPLARMAVERRSSEQVSKLSDLSQMNPFYSVVPETTVAQIAAVFAKGAHRVAVMQSEREILGILSQARIIRYFYEHAEEPHISSQELTLLDRSLKDLGLVTHDIVVATPTTPVIQALSMLERWHISSIAIVEDNRIVGNLSVTDIKYLIMDKSLVNGTCMELVQKVRFVQGVQDGQDRAAVFAVRPEATLRYAMTKMIATGAHRVWITEPQGAEQPDMSPRPRYRRASVSSASSQTVPIAPAHYAGAFDDSVCGIVSLTDVLRLLVENGPKPTPDPSYNYASMD
ncbi:cell separation during budding [Coemansia spiralis]|uniref:Cell separation during budding n=2 Tax=Coemansia TaxID=4863 RepID=A0A9W8G1X0_9FUNG|nr:hypothetical protein BX070DRAFT_231365 [Coemansia spiralis]KAJ1987262.1 cell separation during budding [Coemansia umbellata]KAJ2619146.1 cell separation during budding [Coemansia sp. RSA 1358]KAJ2670057.1 cell separation during budding [Coemansia spiralis]